MAIAEFIDVADRGMKNDGLVQEYDQPLIYHSAVAASRSLDRRALLRRHRCLVFASGSVQLAHVRRAIVKGASSERIIDSDASGAVAKADYRSR